MTLNHSLIRKLSRLFCFILFLLAAQFCVAGEKVLLKDQPINFSVKAEVVAILTFFDDEVLLLQRLPTHPQANLWCAPGGKIHFEETAKDAAIRELFEETGIKIEEELLIDLGKYYVRYPNGDFIFYLYKTNLPKMDQQNIRISEAEHQNFCICSVQEIADFPLTPGLDECFEIAINKN